MAYSALYCVAVVFLLLQNASATKLPDYVSVCNRNSPELSQCLKENWQSLGRHLKNGIPEFQIPPASQLVIPSIHLGQKQSPLMKIDVTLKDVKFDGLETYDVIDAKINLDDPSIYIQLHFQELTASAIEYAKGNVLNMTIDGEARAKIKNKEATITCEWNGEKYSRDGKQHLKLKIRNHRSTISNFEVDIKNFFGQDPNVDAAFNRMINENTDLLREDIQFHVAEITCGMFTMLQNQVLSLFSLDQFFS